VAAPGGVRAGLAIVTVAGCIRPAPSDSVTTVSRICQREGVSSWRFAQGQYQPDAFAWSAMGGRHRLNGITIAGSGG